MYTKNVTEYRISDGEGHDDGGHAAARGPTTLHRDRNAHR